ncbi:MAG TPA: OsmC family protein [Terrimicrobiaceae bacterium]|nr:OsmC family protein [Terrimicrobiaceae bacterium]
MNVENLRALQEPLKAAYRQEPASAIVILRANAVALDGVACRLDTGRALVEAGLHPAAGGDGSQACSGDMLLQALVACAGVTLSAVANSLGVRLRKAEVFAEGELDFRGTLAVARDAPVGFRALRLRFAIDTEADQSTLAKIVELTERYCVVLRTLQASPPIAVTYNRTEDSLTS